MDQKYTPTQEQPLPVGNAQNPPGYQQYPAGYPQNQAGTATVVSQYQPAATVVTAPGGFGSHGTCPSCHNGIVLDKFTCCGICLGICCFPVGLVCCFLMKENRCSSCGAKFSVD